MIEVRRICERGSLDFEVVVREGVGETRHHVTMSREMCERLTAGRHTPERCLEAAFRFLLDREPKESILGRFDLTVISRYFPNSSGSYRITWSDSLVADYALIAVVRYQDRERHPIGCFLPWIDSQLCRDPPSCPTSPTSTSPN
jgi:hypothetical protein